MINLFSRRPRPSPTELLLQMLSHRKGPSPADLMTLACKAGSRRPKAALLWLVDPECSQLILDEVVFPAATDEQCAELTGMFIPLSRDANSLDPEVLLAPERQQRIRAWSDRFLLGAHSTVFELQLPGQSGNAYLQLLSAKAKLNRHTDFALLAQAIGAAIDRANRRRSRALATRLGERLGDLSVRTDDWLRISAEHLTHQAKARLCLIFRHDSEEGLSLAVAHPDPHRSLELQRAGAGSLAAAIARTTHAGRVRDFADHVERARTFKTSDFDEGLAAKVSGFLGEPIQSLAAAPVRIDNHAVAVVMLLNSGSLPARQFRPHDQLLLEWVCDFLRRIIPSIETYLAMAKISTLEVSPDPNDASHREALMKLLRELFPGLTTAFISLKPEDGGPTIRWLDESLTAVQRERFESARLPKPRSLVEGPGSTFLYAERIPKVPDSQALLTVALRRKYLSEYERTVLSFLCAEIAQYLRAEVHIKKQHEDIVQVRHAIRSGVHGIEHLHTARTAYEVYEKTQDERILTSARFRKAIDWSWHFAKKTRVLMEESRFLFQDYTAESLRPGSHSISDLVKEVIRGLRPAAERRRIEVDLQNELRPEEDQVHIDRELIDMSIFNLVDNAIKYSHRDREVSCRLRSERGNWIFSVMDYGLYIEERHRDVIFDQFERRPTGATASSRPGTGLGLAVVRAIAIAHDGSVSVSSELVSSSGGPVGRTVFTLTIPRRPRRGKN